MSYVSNNRISGYVPVVDFVAEKPIDNRRASDDFDANVNSKNFLQKNDISQISMQLSEASARAKERDGNYGRRDLGDFGRARLAEISGPGYHQSRAQHDAEIPRTDNPELLARARQATDFAHGKGGNPFNGLSQQQLALIIYDDGDGFTVNERRAAWSEYSRQDQQWREQVAARAVEEYNRTFKQTDLFKEVLAHYQELSPVEQAQYPAGYPVQLQSWIDQDIDLRGYGRTVENDPFDFISVLQEKIIQDEASRSIA